MLFFNLLSFTSALAYPSRPPSVPTVLEEIVLKNAKSISTPELSLIMHNINLGKPIQQTERSLIYLVQDQGTKYILKAYKSPNLQQIQREHEILKMLARDKGDIIKVNGVFYLPQKYMPGDTLDQVLGQLKSNPKKQQDLIARAAKALRVLHGKGIIHNDSHTGNFIVSPGGQIHLIDFGESLLTSELTKQEIKEGKDLDHIQFRYFANLE